jgi:hypothetical protein
MEVYFIIIIIWIALLMIFSSALLLAKSAKLKQNQKIFAAALCVSMANALNYIGGIILLLIIISHLFPKVIKDKIKRFITFQNI